MQDDIAEGDQVQHKDGGPVMQVAGATAQFCYCSWIDESGNFQQGKFARTDLQKIPGEPDLTLP